MRTSVHTILAAAIASVGVGAKALGFAALPIAALGVVAQHRVKDSALAVVERHQPVIVVAMRIGVAGPARVVGI